MKKNIKFFCLVFVTLLVINSCAKKEYSLGSLDAPANLKITTEVVGANTANPNGDGSGDVKITITADNALSYKLDYDANTAVDLIYLPTGIVTKKYTTIGTNTYRITAIAYGKGGTSSTITKDVTIKSDFTPAAIIVTNLIGSTGSKSWVVDKSVPGHFGVGPWDINSASPVWWSAGIDEKVACCPCFYSTTYKFTKVTASNSYTLQVTSPQGAFTKTGGLTTLPGIPSSGGEGCYSYAGATANFSFVPSNTNLSIANSTQTSILLGSNSLFIGYGSLQREYEIIQLTPTYMYLKVQGTETGNAWFLKLKAI